MRILIAEDDAVSRKLLEAMLTKWGYTVIATCDGESALKVLQAPDSPRLAILDWMMPGMDGVQVCQEMRRTKHEPYIYLMLLTAKSQKGDTIEGLEAGADDYITKPFDAQELRARLRAGMRILDLQSELLSVRRALEEQATHDSLTGLPNRLLFSDRLTRKISECKRRNAALAVMFLDLDGFKLVNDTLGHNVGDSLLVAVSERLVSTLREVDTVARMGGDEFTVIAGDIEGPVEAAAIAERALRSLSQSFHLSGHEVFVSASIGISIYPSDGTDVETLVRNADTAMYRAKERGRSRYQLYTESLNQIANSRMNLVTSLRRAVDGDEFVVHYQPRVDLRNGRILGAEALVRWQHPQCGLLMPADFISVAEDTGLIVPISEWVLKTACVQNKAWQDAGYPKIEMAVNVSPKQFQQGDLYGTVKSVLEETGLEGRWLALEITESALMTGPEHAAAVLAELRKLGVRISIDDFGTGYSSLSYLKRFPTDVVKIDRSFVRDIATDPDDAAIAGAVVAMAHSLKLKVVAEGVETLDQLQFLRSLDCDEMQGYFVSRPVPAHSFPEILESGEAPPKREAA